MAAVASFVRLYEEPTLARRFGAEYDAYRRAVPAWWPRRVRAPQGPADDAGVAGDAGPEGEGQDGQREPWPQVRAEPQDAPLAVELDDHRVRELERADRGAPDEHPHRPVADLPVPVEAGDGREEGGEECTQVVRAAEDQAA